MSWGWVFFGLALVVLKDTFDAEPRPRKPTEPCVAHGYLPCKYCVRTAPGGLDEVGSCKGCGYFASTGHHWDTCQYRVR